MSPPNKYEKAHFIETVPVHDESDSKPSHPLVDHSLDSKPNSHQQLSNDLERLQQRDMVLQRHMKRLNFVIRLFSTLMSGYCLGSMLYALITYNNTKNVMLSNGQHPWSPTTVLWPTYLVLATAALTLLMNIITMCLYFKGSAAADRADNISGYIGIALAGVNAVVWAVNAGLFKMANTGNDLWGWSCSPAADALKDEVNGILNFNSLCQVQTGTWIVTIAKTAMYLIMFAIYVVMLSLWINGRRMMRRKEQLMATQAY